MIGDGYHRKITEAEAVALGARNTEYRIASLLRVTVWSVTLFTAALFISLLLCFSVAVFVSVNVFVFH